MPVANQLAIAIIVNVSFIIYFYYLFIITFNNKKILDSDIIEKKRKKRESQSQAEKPRITLGFENELTLDDLCTSKQKS